jgi:DNA replication protein DnaC
LTTQKIKKNLAWRKFDEQGGTPPALAPAPSQEPDDPLGDPVEDAEPYDWSAHRMRFALEASRIPGRFWGGFAERWQDDYHNRSAKLHEAGSKRAAEWAKTLAGETALSDRPGLLFTGPTGCGKSLLAACVAQELMEAYPDATVRWWNVPELFLALRNTMHRDHDGMTEADILQAATGKNLLVLDDLATERPSGYVLENLYLILNRLTESSRSILIATTNLTGPDLVARLSSGKDGDADTARRVFSRLSGLTMPCATFPNTDYRSQ